MAGGLEPRPLQRSPAAAVRLIFAIAGVVAFVLGFIGLDQFLSEPGEDGPRIVDVLYQTIQLFVLEQAFADEGPFPPILEIARFAAPAVTAYALFEAGRLLFAVEARRLRTRSARGHTIVCGDNLLAAGLARRLRATGHRVVTVWPNRGDWTDPPGSWGVIGDPRNPDVLRMAGAARAAAVYVCTEDTAANAAIALSAGRSTHARGPAAVYAHVDDPELCLALQARYLSSARPSRLRLDFFNIDELAARYLCAVDPLRQSSESPPHVLIAGASTFGRAVIVELARQWRLSRAVPDARLRISVVGEAASATIGELAFRYPFLNRVCRLNAHDIGLADWLRRPALLPMADRVLICDDDEQTALKTALTADFLWSGGPGSVVVRQDHLGTFQGEFANGAAGRLFDEVSGTLRLFGVVDACDPDLVRDDLAERLARAIHERYLLARRRAGPTGGLRRVGGLAPAGDPRGAVEASVQPWDALDERFRRDNHAQAADIGRKLQEVTCVLAPRIRPGDEYVLTATEIKRLAQLEHERWLADRVDAGWRYGEQRDDERRVHPAIRHWGELPEPMRRRNRDAIRELPKVLADCGFRIVRR